MRGTPVGVPLFLSGYPQSYRGKPERKANSTQERREDWHVVALLQAGCRKRRLTDPARYRLNIRES